MSAASKFQLKQAVFPLRMFERFDVFMHFPSHHKLFTKLLNFPLFSRFTVFQRLQKLLELLAVLGLEL